MYALTLAGVLGLKLTVADNGRDTEIHPIHGPNRVFFRTGISMPESFGPPEFGELAGVLLSLGEGGPKGRIRTIFYIAFSNLEAN